MNDLFYMERAIQQAKLASAKEEVPVGAVIVLENEIIAESHNNSITSLDPSCHAEIEVIKLAASRLGNYRILDAVMYVTLEPCMMCCGALVHARMKEVVFGAKDSKSGAVLSNANLLDSHFLNHKVDYRQGPLEEESANLLKNFFSKKRN